MARRRGLAGMSRKRFEERWLRVFGEDIPLWKLNRYGNGQYIWHVFSWRLLDDAAYLTGDAAMAAYAQVSKERACCIQPFEDQRVSQLPDGLSDPQDINRSCVELYVVGKNWQWTYIKTHEGDLCGPYFMWCGGRMAKKNEPNSEQI